MSDVPPKTIPLTSSKDRLDAEERAARDDIARALRELGATITGTTRQAGKDATGIAASHPFLTLSGAALAGFAAASMVVPSKKEQLLAKFAAIEQALQERDRPRSKPKSTLAGTVAKTAFKLLKPKLTNLVLAALAAKGFGAAPPTPESNGHPADVA